MATKDPDSLGDIARAILDGTPVDWDAADAGDIDHGRGLVQQLRLVADIVHLHRELNPPHDSLQPTSDRSDGPSAREGLGQWGHLTLLERIGHGAFGEVYRAWDQRLEREVALKLLDREPATQAQAETLLREARLLARVQHPNVVSVFDTETIDGRAGIRMEFVRGRTLEQVVRDRGPLNVGQAASIGVMLCRALSAVHRAGLLHGDITARNVVQEDSGRVVLMDFGAGRHLDVAQGSPMSDLRGTPLYMAPEVLAGQAASIQSDLYSLGILLYHVVTAAFPVTGRTLHEVNEAHRRHTRTPLAKIRPDLPEGFVRIVERAAAPEPERRFTSADVLEAELTLWMESKPGVEPRAADVLRWLRRPMIAVPAAAVLVLTLLGLTWSYRRTSRIQWARDVGIPEILRLADAEEFRAAFSLAMQIEATIPDDPILATSWTQFSNPIFMASEPAGANVDVQAYGAAESAWEPLGQTPLENVRLPRGVFRFRVAKQDHDIRFLVSTNPGPLLQAPREDGDRPITIGLSGAGVDPDMVAVPGGVFPVSLTGFNSNEPVDLGPFLMDRTEVTNRSFQRFVDAGGYATSENWSGLPFLEAGGAVSLSAALQRFRDSTGQPGPSGWTSGRYPQGHDDDPVGGVSWYEAAVYCRSQDKTLPTLFHWTRTALSPNEIANPLAPAIIPLSNYGSGGPAPVGQFRGMGPYGSSDMAGNVREWVWNETTNQRRGILGGSWNDPTWSFVQPASAPPFDRAPSNGFRCARYATERFADHLLDPVPPVREYASVAPVSDEVLQVFERQLAYVRTPLNARVESTDTTHADWVREEISFEAGYEPGRVSAYVFLPRAARPPYQLVVYFPPLTAFASRASSDELQPGMFDFVVKSGRALVWPIYRGSYERWDAFLSLGGDEYLRTFRTRMFQWRHDIGAVLDVMSARPDIDQRGAAYLGFSFGASTALPLLALEDRLTMAVLVAPGFTYRALPPEADAINYVPHVTIPVLMLGGRHDYVMPFAESQQPLFRLLGTRRELKRHVVFDAGHYNFPRAEMIREALTWFDAHLGAVPRMEVATR